MFENYTIARKFYLNDHLIDSISGNAATNNGLTFTEAATPTPSSTLIALENGYFLDEPGNKIIDPVFSSPNFEGGKLHNLINSFIRFDSALMDRSNATIWNADCRLSTYYDAGNPSFFHYSELAYDILNSYLNTDYQDRIFTAIKQDYSTQKWYFEIFSYSTKKTGDDLIKVLKYINY